MFVQPMELEVVNFYKYLGVQIEARPTAMYYRAYEQVIVKKAKKYLNLIRVKSRAFPDVGVAVHQLWVSVALPSIMYGMETTAVSVATWRTLESVQARLGKFILQVPRSTQNICAVVGCGFTPIRFVHMDRVYGQAVRMLESESGLVQEALQVMEGQGGASLVYRQVEELLPYLDSEPAYRQYREDMIKLYVEDELYAVRKTTFLFRPMESLNLKERPYVEIAEELKGEMHKFLFLNAGLGNRCPTKDKVKFKVCVACALAGIHERINEIHLLLVCPRYKATRMELGLQGVVEEVVQQYGGGEDGYGVFWGKGYNLHVEQLEWRLQCAIKLREVYLEDVVVLKPLYYRYILEGGGGEKGCMLCIVLCMLYFVCYVLYDGGYSVCVCYVL